MGRLAGLARSAPAFALAFLAMAATGAAGAGLAGTHTIALIEAGAERAIGTVTLRADGDGYRFEVVLDDAQFEDHFLSMRPFKCLEHSRYLLCHLPYPYENRRRITAGDLVDLEYDLLFIRKAPSEYGINPYNGLYYRLALDGDAIRGTLHETDLDALAAPPEASDLRPIEADALYETEPEAHPYPTLLID